MRSYRNRRVVEGPGWLADPENQDQARLSEVILEFDPPSEPEDGPARAGPVFNGATISGPFSNVAEEDAALGDWPRRLLHVPSMTSHEWQPGNVYGGWDQPLYNAVSYTWGRWKIDPKEQPLLYEQTTPLQVENLPWEIPRIKPDGFTAEGFHTMLKRAIEVRPQEDTPGNIQFIWVDVACIDQREEGGPDQMKADAEVGRQAKIFGHARSTLIWTHGTSKDTWDSARSAFSNTNMDLPPADLDQAKRAALRLLLEDPWFDSLWALQEAFLCPGATIITRQGIVPNPTSLHFDPAYQLLFLGQLLGWARAWSNTPPQNSSEDRSQKDGSIARDEILALLDKKAILKLETGNPLVAYTAAIDRRAEREEDRVYAIQQMFRLRLGKSAAPGIATVVPAHSDREYSLDELRTQFGEQLMLEYPTLSQMHCYVNAQPPGMAWRVHEDSKSPGYDKPSALFEMSPDYPKSPKVWQSAAGFPACPSFVQLEACIRDGKTWGKFQGRMCSFKSFLKKAREMGEGQSGIEIWPDVTEELSTRKPANPDLDQCLRKSETISNTLQSEYATWLAGEFEEEKLQVLLLGEELPDYFTADRNMLGMLLYYRDGADQPLKYWRRFGIFRRTFANRFDGTPRARETAKWLEGKTADWVTRGDLFG